MMALASLRQVLSKLKRGRKGEVDTNMDTFLEGVIGTFSGEAKDTPGNDSKMLDQLSKKSKQGGMQYLMRFLQYAVDVASQLRRCGEDSHDLSILQMDPKRILSRVVFERKGLQEARELSELMGIDLRKLLLRSTIGRPEINPTDQCSSPLRNSCRASSPNVECAETPYSDRNLVEHASSPFANQTLHFQNEKSKQMESKASMQSDLYDDKHIKDEPFRYCVNMDVVKFLAALETEDNDSLEERDQNRRLLLSPLASILRQSEAPLDGALIWYALEKSVAHPILHRWICCKAQTAEDVIRISLEGKSEQQVANNYDSRFIEYNYYQFKKWSTWKYTSKDAKETCHMHRRCLHMLFAEDGKHSEDLYLSLVENLIHKEQFKNAVALSDATLSSETPGMEEMLLKLATLKRTQQSNNNDNIEEEIDYFVRMRGRIAPARVALQFTEKWPVEVGINVLTMYESRLQEKEKGNEFEEEAILSRISKRLEKLRAYRDILQTDCNCNWSGKWQHVEKACETNPAAVARLLSDCKEHALAIKVIDIFQRRKNSDKKSNKSVDKLELEFESDWILDLLVRLNNRDFAFRKLKLLGQQAVPLCRMLLIRVECLDTKLLLVRFLLSMESEQYDENTNEQSKISILELSLQILLRLPKDLQEKLRHLESKPSLIVESLLLMEKISLVAELFDEFDELRQDDVITTLAERALKIDSNVQLRYPSTVALTGDLITDENIREKHKFSSAPSTKFAMSLLDLCSDARTAGNACFIFSDLLSNLIVKREKAPLVKSMILQLIQYAKRRFREISGPDSVQGLRYCSRLLESLPLLEELYHIAAHCDGCSMLRVTLSDLFDVSCVESLRNLLISPEIDQISVALKLCETSGSSSVPVYVAWGLSLIRVGRDEEAREKFEHCFGEMKSKKNEKENLLVQIVEELLQRGSTFSLDEQLRSMSMQLLDDRTNLQRTILSNENNPFHGNKGNNDGSFSQLLPTENEMNANKKECIWYLRKFGTAKNVLTFLLHYRMPLSIVVREIMDENISARECAEIVLDGVLAHEELDRFYRELRKLPPKLRLNVRMKHFLLAALSILRKKNLVEPLYKTQVFTALHAEAGLTCGEMFEREANAVWLERAGEHFLIAMRKLKVTDLKQGSKEIAKFKVLKKHADAVTLQKMIGKVFPNTSTKLSLLAKPNESDASLHRRRCAVVADLVRSHLSYEKKNHLLGATESEEQNDVAGKDEQSRLLHLIIKRMNLSKQGLLKIAHYVNTFLPKSKNLSAAPLVSNYFIYPDVDLEDPQAVVHIETSDGGYVMAGKGMECGDNCVGLQNRYKMEGFVTKTNAKGVIVWTWISANVGADDVINGVIQLPSGAIIAVGFRTINGVAKRSMTKLNVSNGKEEWTSTSFGDSTNSNGAFEFITLAHDKTNVLLAGLSLKPDSENFFFKSYGNTEDGKATISKLPVSVLSKSSAPTVTDVTWTTILPGFQTSKKAILMPNGESVAAELFGEVEAGTHKASAALLNYATGAKIWTNFYGDGMEGTDIVASTDGKYLLVSGHGESALKATGILVDDAPVTGISAKLLKIDAKTGKKIWIKSYTAADPARPEMIYNECWGVSHWKSGYALSCGTGIENCKPYSNGTCTPLATCSALLKDCRRGKGDTRAGASLIGPAMWCSLTIGVSFDGDLLWQRVDQHAEPDDGKPGTSNFDATSSAAEYLVTNPTDGKIVVLTDEQNGFGLMIMTATTTNSPTTTTTTNTPTTTTEGGKFWTGARNKDTAVAGPIIKKDDSTQKDRDSSLSLSLLLIYCTFGFAILAFIGTTVYRRKYRKRDDAISTENKIIRLSDMLDEEEEHESMF
eukprot:g2465.t1